MQIIYCNITKWNAFEGLEYLNTKRQKSFERYMQYKDKLRCLIGGLLLYYAFGHNKQALHNAYGKPYFENDICFNLSHSGDFVALALSTNNIGIDVEIVKKFNMDVAKKCFTIKEVKWLKEQSTPQAFFKIWTAKESIMKAIGCGFSLNPASFEVLPIVNGSHKINEQEWFLFWHSLPEHELCVASEISAKPTEIIQLQQQQILQKIYSIHK